MGINMYSKKENKSVFAETKRAAKELCYPKWVVEKLSSVDISLDNTTYAVRLGNIMATARKGGVA